MHTSGFQICSSPLPQNKQRPRYIAEDRQAKFLICPNQRVILWMDEILHHPRSQGMMIPCNYQQWFLMVSIWCRIASIHSSSRPRLFQAQIRGPFCLGPGSDALTSIRGRSAWRARPPSRSCGSSPTGRAGPAAPRPGKSRRFILFFSLWVWLLWSVFFF